MPKKKLTHIDSRGRASMVDVTNKVITTREAIATGSVLMKKETLKLITDDKIAKGNVFETARLAGIMAAKKTSGLIPLCHPLMITSVSVDFKPVKTKGRVDIIAKVKCAGRTGVEMETLTAASIAALTIYDMCKAVDRGMVISDIMLQEKRGGKSGVWKRK
ncbi:MAG TPA: cyclic pyranopterin monophosphate synthase MoaC [Nitrospirae bacterium]|nr:cyclic pyranopterin monophosphate synthase MoaC [Nitrospirota bacterium]HDZ83847.1 cyclic pyranopterin monophosphate synthase MoaC [Nitrospirota bacterium]